MIYKNEQQWLAFADDRAIISQHKNKFKRMIRTINLTGNIFDLSRDQQITAFMIMGDIQGEETGVM